MLESPKKVSLYHNPENSRSFFCTSRPKNSRIYVQICTYILLLLHTDATEVCARAVDHLQCL